MSKRSNHYEAAFEEYLRAKRAPYIAIDESRRSLLPYDLPEDAVGSLKSLDFLVTSAAQGCTWLVDVKGRQFPSGAQKRLWKNWSTHDDVASMGRWQNLFRGRFQSLFVFAYNIVGDVAPLPEDRLFDHRDRKYAFLGVRLEHFAAHARLISPKWQTLAMPSAAFRQWAQPMDDLL
ncbi:MAG: HYExAFE family protein [Planctomycetaceae bacterium]|nr:HYExAFE family protein [Planctomycetaceae bacterium]